MYEKQTIGKFGEDLACKYLEENDYRILDRNFSCMQGEIDIIAYDTKNGERHNKTGEDGEYLIRDLEGDELQAVLDSAASMMSKVTANEKDFATFDKYASDTKEYPNGIYITKDSEYVSDVIDAVYDMKIGEIRTVTSDFGVHIIMRYELEDDGYKKSANSDFFISTETGNYFFLNDLKNQLLSNMLASHKVNITVDYSQIEGVDMKSVDPNFYY